MKGVLIVVLFFTLNVSAQNSSVVLEGKSGTARIVAEAYPAFGFLLPEMAGSLEFGLIQGDTSLWLKDIPEVERTAGPGSVKYTLQAGGELTVQAVSLPTTDGLILEVTARNFPDGTQLLWAYGGASGKAGVTQPALLPEYCRYNVFSVEGTAFTVYYGESMKLKVLQAVMPPASEIRLSDAFRQETPRGFFESGKKTQAPALAAVLPLKNDQKEYFCIYRQNASADYNYFMLPEVFRGAKAHR